MTTRRQALAMSASAVAAVSLTGIAAKASQQDRLPDVIHRHEIALSKLSAACARVDQLETALKQETGGRVLVPIAIDKNGDCHSGYLELGIFNEDAIRSKIDGTHGELLRLHCSNWSKTAVPGFADEMERSIELSRQRAHGRFDEILAHIENQEQDLGLTTARELMRAASAEEVEARVDVILHHPHSDTESAQKQTYLSTAYPFTEGWHEDDATFMPTLMAKTLEVKA